MDRFVGAWRTEYRVPRAEWTPVEKTGAASLTYRRVLGGEFVREQGEHTDETTALRLYTYDTHQKCYRTWWFSSTGQASEATGQWDADTKTLAWTTVADPARIFTMTSSHHFVNDDLFEWKVVAKDKTGKILFQMEGKATRTNDSDKSAPLSIGDN